MFIWPSEEKYSGTCAFSKAEAWWRSTVKMWCQWSHLRQYAQAHLSTVLWNMFTCTPVGSYIFQFYLFTDIVYKVSDLMIISLL